VATGVKAKAPDSLGQNPDELRKRLTFAENRLAEWHAESERIRRALFNAEHPELPPSGIEAT
jgi:hypothetical protein